MAKTTIPESESQLSVVHEGGVGHIERSGAPEGWPRQQDVRVLQQEGQVVEHGLLVLAARAAEVTQELAARHYHLMRGVLQRDVISSIQYYRQHVEKTRIL